MWIFLSLIGAFTQSLEAAIKKKSLQVGGMNTVIGTLSFLVAGIVFFIIMLATVKSPWPFQLSSKFWEAMFWYAGLNLIASWYGYKALDIAEFSFLAPFIAITSLTIVFPPIFILGEFPKVSALIGIAFVVAGSIVMSFRKKSAVFDAEKSKRDKDNLKGLMYFFVVIICFTFTPTATKVAIQESSPIFTSFLVHILIAMGFLVMTFAFKKTSNLVSVLVEPPKRKLLLAILVMGLLTFLENGSINAAMAMAPVSIVMAIKRIAPLFSFLIGITYFHERADILKKLVGSLLMVSGAILIIAL
ncbi:MAG: EamA family transporter [Candidatus Moraniibacteriota bacterium]